MRDVVRINASSGTPDSRGCGIYQTDWTPGPVHATDRRLRGLGPDDIDQVAFDTGCSRAPSGCTTRWKRSDAPSSP
jgi:hypothetical protein